jgi:DNA gyrase subunit B
MDVTVYRDGKKYELHFEKGENIGGLKVEEAKTKRTGTIHRWKPDIEVLPILIYPPNILRKP